MNWRQQVRRCALAPAPMPVFVPVRITPDPAVSVPVMPPSPASGAFPNLPWGRYAVTVASEPRGIRPVGRFP